MLGGCDVGENGSLKRLIERLLAENAELKAQWRAEYSDEPFPMAPEEERNLEDLRDRLSPRMREKLGQDNLFDRDDAEPSS